MMDNKVEGEEHKEEEQKKEQEKPIEIQPPKEVEKKPVGLASQVKEMNEKIDMMTQAKTSKAKKKEFKLPFGMKGQLKKLAKQNKVQIIYLQHNRNIKPTTAEIKEGMIIIDDKVYDGSTDGVWLWNGKIPTMLIAEWDLKPVTADRLLGKAIEDKSISHPQRIIIRAIEISELLQARGKVSSKMLIWGAIGLAIVGYVLFANPTGAG